MHTKDARLAGETEQRIYALNAWRETPFFSDRERAALEWTEAVTRVADTHVPDEVYERVSAQFNEAELVALTFGVVVINWLEPAGGVVPRPGRHVSAKACPGERCGRCLSRARSSAGRRPADATARASGLTLNTFGRLTPTASRLLPARPERALPRTISRAHMAGSAECQTVHPDESMPTGPQTRSPSRRRSRVRVRRVYKRLMDRTFCYSVRAPNRPRAGRSCSICVTVAPKDVRIPPKN